MTSVLIVAGETSGERYGAGLVRAFRRIRSDVRFFGIGGTEMERAGVEILHPLRDLAVVGVFEVLTRLPRLKRIFRRLLRIVEERRPAAAVLIDSPDFNLRLAKKLKEAGVPVLYYVSPTVWAWRRRRLNTVRKCVRRMLLIFPFEKEIYDREGIPAVYVGHPLFEYLTIRRTANSLARRYGWDVGKKLVAILPGSRPGEIERHLPVLGLAARRMNETQPLNLVLLLADNIDPEFLRSRLPPGLRNAPLVREDRFDVMAASDLVLSACGTANLETAVLGRPLVTFYRISPLTYFFGRRLVRIRRFSIVNILAGRDVVPELIQHRFTPEAVCAETLRLLNDRSARRAMAKEFARLRRLLGRKRPSAAAASELKNILDG